MSPILRIAGIVVVLSIVSVAWLVLGGIMVKRTSSQGDHLQGEVSGLWGNSQSQLGPELNFHWTTEEEDITTEKFDGTVKKIRKTVILNHKKKVSPRSSDIDVDLQLKERLKGLMWYALYDVDFSGSWVYEHRQEMAGQVEIAFTFPDRSGGLYDNLSFVINGEEMVRTLQPKEGRMVTLVEVEPGQEIKVSIGYTSRGMDEWTYIPDVGVSNLENFKLRMKTDFDTIDFPHQSMSPSTKERTEDGWQLVWQFKQVVTGHTVGMLMPSRLQPGELASSLSFSAPISLFFFFLVLFVLGVMRKIDIHPINYLLLSGAFFAFHLLFGYMVDHLHVVTAFAISSAVSVILVTTYLRLVVSARFACVEAALAQLIYLVGFSMAHFWDGFTGLTVSVLSTLTLFLIMQMTGRVNWTQALARTPEAASSPPIAGGA